MNDVHWTTRAWPYARRGLIGLGAGCAIAAAGAAAYVAYILPSVPSKQDLLEIRIAKPSTLLSADGKPLAVFRRAKQERVRLEQVSPQAINALIATEDRRFFEHRGIDLRRTAMAVLQTLKGETQGGSTITQQLARNLFPDEIGRDRTVHRKVKELLTALKIERLYTKKQILETYLNSVPFLYNVVGIEMAARTYYDKSAADLDALESATLVGMLKGSSIYNPVINPERSLARRNVVLAGMVSNRALTEPERRALAAQPLHVRFNRQPLPAGPAPHFSEHVRKWLIEWADKNDYDIYSDGLVVQTTIDASLQDLAMQAVQRQAEMLQTIADVEWGEKAARVASSAPDAYAKLRAKVVPFEHFWQSHKDLLDTFAREAPEYAAALKAAGTDAEALAALRSDGAFLARLKSAKSRLEAGFVAIDPASGEVRAWVGSRDFDTDQFDHAMQAERQPGSTFKPFVYGAALERGIGPEHQYLDAPMEIKLSDGRIWKPTDMSGSSGEMMTLREGLIRSKNTITVQVMQDVGVPGVVRLAQAMGVDRSKLDPVPSLALGTSPVTLMEMVSGYSTIAGSGEYRKPIFIKRVIDRNGKVLAEFGNESRRAMSAPAAVELIDIMRGVVTRGTGQAVKTRFGIVADLGGKTGTTQRNTDGWFILMHPALVAGAWVGFNDTRVTMRSNYWGQGGHNAIFIVGDFFREALRSGRLDANAQFPHPPRPVLAAVEADAAVDAARKARPVEDVQEGAPIPVTVPVAVVRREDGVFVGESVPRASDRRADRPARSAEELARIMRGMGRDPETGAGTGAPAVTADPPVIAVPAAPAAEPRADPGIRPPPEPEARPVPMPADGAGASGQR